MVAALDEVVANVTAALQANGMWENTVFWLVSDNGGETMDAVRCSFSDRMLALGIQDVV
jgi:arylsulfatase A-like enzyme